MTTEMKNDTNNNDTVEQAQNQNGAPQAAPSDPPALAAAPGTATPEPGDGLPQLETRNMEPETVKS
jgi:hypothetical protein